MSQYSIRDFVQRSTQKDRGQGVFELETDRLLEVNLNGFAWIKAGAMVAYTGTVKFTREGMLERGLGNFLKKAVSGEGATFTKAEGQGQVYLADAGKKIVVLDLEGQSLFVNGNDVLAFEPTVQYDIQMMKRVASVVSGGLFSVRLEGAGRIAITCHHDPLTLRVTPDQPVMTDPNATVAWSGSLTPQLKTDISFKTFLGRGSGESIQMRFEGDGFVIVQPYEEVYMQHTAG